MSNASLNEVQKDILDILSTSISVRTGKHVVLHNIMDYEDYRRNLSEYKKEDFITEGSRGSLALATGDIILPSDMDKMRQDNATFFKVKS